MSDIQISNSNLNVELTDDNIQVSNHRLNVELTGNDIQVAGLCLQVEIIEGFTPIIKPVVEDTIYPELILPRFKPVELISSNEQHLADGLRELNRNLDWTFRSLTKAIIERKRLKNNNEDGD